MKKKVELYHYSQQTREGLHPSKQKRCDGNLTATVPEGLFIEKLVKFTLLSKVLKFLFGFKKKKKIKKTLFKLNDVEATVIIFKGWKSHKKERIFLYSYLTNNSCRPATNLFLVLFMIYLKFDLKCQKVPHTSIYVWYLFASENLHQTSHETHSLVMLIKLHCSCPQMSSSIVIDLHASGIFPQKSSNVTIFSGKLLKRLPHYTINLICTFNFTDCLLQTFWIID